LTSIFQFFSWVRDVVDLRAKVIDRAGPSFYKTNMIRLHAWP
jgi:hypothetical protein